LDVWEGCGNRLFYAITSGIRAFTGRKYGHSKKETLFCGHLTNHTSSRLHIFVEFMLEEIPVNLKKRQGKVLMTL
jgi:hypothetical protein